MGSRSDWETMRHAAGELDGLGAAGQQCFGTLIDRPAGEVAEAQLPARFGACLEDEDLDAAGRRLCPARLAQGVGGRETGDARADDDDTSRGGGRHSATIRPVPVPGHAEGPRRVPGPFACLVQVVPDD